MGCNSVTGDGKRGTNWEIKVKKWKKNKTKKSPTSGQHRGRHVRYHSRQSVGNQSRSSVHTQTRDTKRANREDGSEARVNPEKGIRAMRAPLPRRAGSRGAEYLRCSPFRFRRRPRAPPRHRRSPPWARGTPCRTRRTPRNHTTCRRPSPSRTPLGHIP